MFSLFDHAPPYSTDEDDEMEAEITNAPENHTYIQQTRHEFCEMLKNTQPSLIITKHDTLDKLICRPVRNEAEAYAAGVPARVEKQVLTRYMDNDEGLLLRCQKFSANWVAFRDQRYLPDSEWPHNNEQLRDFDKFGTDTKIPKRQFFDRHCSVIFWAAPLESKGKSGNCRKRRTNTMRVQYKRPGTKDKVTLTLGRKAGGSVNGCKDDSHRDETMPCVVLIVDSTPPNEILEKMREERRRERDRLATVRVRSMSPQMDPELKDVSSLSMMSPTPQPTELSNLPDLPPSVGSLTGDSVMPATPLSEAAFTTPPPGIHRYQIPLLPRTSKRRSLSESQETDSTTASVMSASSLESGLSVIRDDDGNGGRSQVFADLIQFLSEVSENNFVPKRLKYQASRFRIKTSEIAHQLQYGEMDGSDSMNADSSGDSDSNFGSDLGSDLMMGGEDPDFFLDEAGGGALMRDDDDSNSYERFLSNLQPRAL